MRLRITDDGIGLPDPLPRSSGISNLMNRARNLGGTATWTANEPTGTVFVWQVPRDGCPAALEHRRRARPRPTSTADEARV